MVWLLFGFKKKESSFSSQKANLGEGRLGFLKPTSKELGEIKKGSRLSSTPYGKIAKKKKQKPRNYFAEARDIFDFREPYEKYPKREKKRTPKRNSSERRYNPPQKLPSVLTDVIGDGPIIRKAVRERKFDPSGLNLVSDDFGLL